jgi:type I restriction enzyme S subunit
MSEEVTLDEFAKRDERDEQGQKWKNVQLHEIAYKRSENVDPQEIDLEKHIGLEHIEPNNPVPDWESVDGLSSTKRRFEAGDILFAKLRPNLEKSAQPDFMGVASTDIFPIVAEDNINSKWLLYRLSSKPAYDYARRTSAGTRMPRTSWNLFSNFEFGLPPLSEQRKIATILYTVDCAIEKTDEIKEQVSRLKRGVAQNLFRSGLIVSRELFYR